MIQESAFFLLITLTFLQELEVFCSQLADVARQGGENTITSQLSWQTLVIARLHLAAGVVVKKNLALGGQLLFSNKDIP